VARGLGLQRGRRGGERPLDQAVLVDGGGVVEVAGVDDLAQDPNKTSTLHQWVHL